jgi:RNA-directed DNA polymerase
MQKRIYNASREGNLPTVFGLQRRVLHSVDARLWAVQMVTTNRGKHTPGVDRQKSLTAKQKERLAGKIKLDSKASALRRAHIHKRDNRKTRPPGIPTVRTEGPNRH